MRGGKQFTLLVGATMYNPFLLRIPFTGLEVIAGEVNGVTMVRK